MTGEGFKIFICVYNPFVCLFVFFVYRALDVCCCYLCIWYYSRLRRSVGTSDENLHEDEENKKKVNPVFDLMLYINLPIVFVLLYYFFNQIDSNVYSTSELIGLSLSAGILLATNAINVAHELCHRKNYFEKFIGKMLFMPCLYMHFYIEHNYGHHIKVATPDDGATAKYNQSVYNFWFTSYTSWV